jgi:cytochrome c-type biogenesis protein CcmE
LAVTSSETDAPPPVAPPHRRRPWLGSRRRQLVAVLILAGALSYLLYQGLTNATQFFRTADQAVADKAKLGTKPFRIEGTVQHNVHQLGADTDFSIYANGVSVAVVATEQPSQLFQPGIPVVLDGHWQGNVYLADQIMVKHTASYTEAHPDRLKSQLPPSQAP